TSAAERRYCPTSRLAPHRAASAAVAKRRLVAVLAACALLSATSAGAQKLGDFGRVAPGVFNEGILAPLERGWRILDGQPVSDFNQTDAEREMHGRVWRFITASHAELWAVPFEVQIRFAGFGGSQRKSAEDLLYRWLSRERFASSRVRYNAVADY